MATSATSRPSTHSSARKIKRVLITNYGNELVPELIKELPEQSYCLFIIFTNFSDISKIQKGMGKRRIVPLFISPPTANDKGSSNSKELDEIINHLTEMDAILNLSSPNSCENYNYIAKHFEKRIRFKSVEVKLHKTNSLEIRKLLENAPQSLLVNLTQESTVGLTHMFDSTGIEIPISTHITTSLRNSFRKIFAKKSSSVTPPKNATIPFSRSATLPPSSSTNCGSENSKKTGSSFRRSFFRRKPIETEGSPLERLRNEVWGRENESYKKSLNKLAICSEKELRKSINKLSERKIKEMKKVEKDLEGEMNRERAKMQSLNNAANEATMSRVGALTADTANKIVASRQGRVDREVCKIANKRKVEEFNKLEKFYKEQVEETSRKAFKNFVGKEVRILERTRKKYRERMRETEESTLLA